VPVRPIKKNPPPYPMDTELTELNIAKTEKITCRHCYMEIDKIRSSIEEEEEETRKNFACCASCFLFVILLICYITYFSLASQLKENDKIIRNFTRYG